jgi:hypothetical protein
MLLQSGKAVLRILLIGQSHCTFGSALKKSDYLASAQNLSSAFEHRTPHNHPFSFDQMSADIYVTGIG